MKLNLKRLLGAVLLVLGLGALSPARADDDVLLQGFWWDVPHDWYDALRAKAADLSRAGFSAVWLPPPSKGAYGRGSMGYDLYDHYDLGEYDAKGARATRFGDVESLLALSEELREVELKPYVDIILTHMTGGELDDHPRRGKTWTKFEHDHGNFPKSWNDFHDDNSVDGCSFGERLNHASGYVRDQLKRWGDWLTKRVGYEGFRIDFAKALDPHFVAEFLNSGAMKGKFAVGEYWDTNVDTLDWWTKTSGASAFDFPLFYTLREMANDGTGGFDMRRLSGAGLLARNPFRSVTFVENHDTDRSQPVSRDKMMAYAYILTAEGYPSVFLKDYEVYGLKDKIDPLLAIRRNLAAGGTKVLHADEHTYIAERAGDATHPGLVVVINNDPTEWKGQWVTVKGDWAGKDLKDHTGNAATKRVAADGRVELWAPPRGYAVYSLDVPLAPKTLARDRDPALDKARADRDRLRDARAGIPIPKTGATASNVPDAVRHRASTANVADHPTATGLVDLLDRKTRDRSKDKAHLR